MFKCLKMKVRMQKEVLTQCLPRELLANSKEKTSSELFFIIVVLAGQLETGFRQNFAMVCRAPCYKGNLQENGSFKRNLTD